MPRTIGVIISSLAVLGFTSIAAAAPFATNIAVDVAAQDLLIQVDFKCRKVDGQIVCGSTKSNKNRDDDDDDDDDDKPKKSKDKESPRPAGRKSIVTLDM